MENQLASFYQKNKLIFKCLTIGFLILILLIPSLLIQNLIREREATQIAAKDEVSSKWGQTQDITGPVLVIPYTNIDSVVNGKAVIAKKYAYFLPSKLEVKSTLNPVKRSRGIYQVMLYNAQANLTGNFSALPLEKLKLSSTSMLWNEAFVYMAVSDMKGLKEEVKLIWNNTNLSLSPSEMADIIGAECISTPIKISPEDAANGIDFSAVININGAEQLLFTPIGKETKVVINSTHPNPSFTGNTLPEESKINKTGFSATWKSMSHTRNFPQQWRDAKYDLNKASVGVNLYIPVNGYQKTLRSVKYSILCILLTFTAFFLIEINNKKSVHPFHYALIGFALLLFYTLLLSISEYTGFNIAYAIASLATVGLITWFVKGLLGSSRLSFLLSFILMLLYSFVFTILQLQDYALLLGSIGLFISLGIVMFFVKKQKLN